MHLTYLHSLGKKAGRSSRCSASSPGPPLGTCLKDHRDFGSRDDPSLASLVQDGTLSEERGLLFFQARVFPHWIEEEISTKESRSSITALPPSSKRIRQSPPKKSPSTGFAPWTGREARPSALLCRRAAWLKITRTGKLYRCIKRSWICLLSEARVAEEACRCALRAESTAGPW